MALRSYRDLQVWQKAMDLTVEVYQLTRKFPIEEKHGLASQLQRAAVSVPANIAEGYARTHRGDYLHHLSIANGSLAEIETHITIAVRLEIIKREDALNIWEHCQEVGKMLRQLMQSLDTAPKPQRAARKSQTLDPRPQTLDLSQGA